MDEKTEPLRALREGEIILAKGTPHEVRIPCAILSDGQRLITATGTIQAFNQDERSHRAGPTQLPRFLQANSVKSALDKELPGPAQALGRAIRKQKRTIRQLARWARPLTQ